MGHKSMALFVIHTYDCDEKESLYWSTEDGFGDLANASVFTEEQAKVYDLPIANDEPEWLQLPTCVYVYDGLNERLIK